MVLLMDPNGGKNNLSNKLSKEEAIERLKKENFRRITVSFYKYIIINEYELSCSIFKITGLL